MPSTSAPGVDPSYGAFDPNLSDPHGFDFHDQGAADARPEYFAGMEEMLVYFEGVTLAVVNYRCVTCQACVTRACDTRV